MRPVRNPVVPFSRDYRTPRPFGMGGTPRPPKRPLRWWHRLANPVFYLRAVIVICGMALVAIPLLADGVLAVSRPMSFGEGRCRVLHVIDGDTVDIWCDATGLERARLSGFDAPELFSPKCALELIAAQRSKWALRVYLFRATDVRLQRKGLDRYDRRLVTLNLDGAPLSKSMIDGGYAKAYGGGARSGWCNKSSSQMFDLYNYK